MIVFTSICANYIPKAKVLANSLKLHNPNFKFAVCLVERSIHPSAYGENIDLVIPVKKLKIPNFERFIYKYSVVEASTAVKGYFFQELLKRFPYENQFVFLDPDILVTGPFDELRKTLTKHNIVLVPHITEPELQMEAIIDNEISSLRHGVFNLGFLGLRRSNEASSFLKWWTARLHEFCFIDFYNGLFTDQRWMDLAPCFFNVHIFKNVGYNVAPWNLSTRKIYKDKKGIYYVAGERLIFYHFSGWDSGANEDMTSTYSEGSKDAIHELRLIYNKLLEKEGQNKLKNLKWSFDYYTNGRKVQQRHRKIYRSAIFFEKVFHDPFNIESYPFFLRYINNPINRVLLPARITYDSIHKKVLKNYKKGGIKLVARKIRKFFVKLLVNKL